MAKAALSLGQGVAEGAASQLTPTVEAGLAAGSSPSEATFSAIDLLTIRSGLHAPTVLGAATALELPTVCPIRPPVSGRNVAPEV